MVLYFKNNTRDTSGKEKRTYIRSAHLSKDAGNRLVTNSCVTRINVFDPFTSMFTHALTRQELTIHEEDLKIADEFKNI